MNDGVNFEPVGDRLFNTNPFALAFKRGGAGRGLRGGRRDQPAPARDARCPGRADHQRATAPPPGPPAPSSGSSCAIPTIRRPSRTHVLGGQESARSCHQLGGHARLRHGFPLAGRGRRRHLRQRSDQVQDAGPDAVGALPAAGSQDEIVQRGKYLFNAAIGPVGTQDNSKRPAGLMSDFGWGSCYGCHPQALADSVTWMFADGPRQSISMESTFAFGAGGD